MHRDSRNYKKAIYYNITLYFMWINNIDELYNNCANHLSLLRIIGHCLGAEHAVHSVFAWLARRQVFSIWSCMWLFFIYTKEYSYYKKFKSFCSEAAHIPHNNVKKKLLYNSPIKRWPHRWINWSAECLISHCYCNLICELIQCSFWLHLYLALWIKTFCSI